MTKPRHVEALEHFKNVNPGNRLEAMIAFALFVDGEQKWADGKKPPPTEEDYRAYYDASLAPHHMSQYMESARRVLLKVLNDVLATRESAFLAKSLSEYRRDAGRGHSRFRMWGVIEALGGAFLWTFVLIAVSIALAWNNIDMLEYLKKAYPPVSERIGH